jgi:hypothetical protein
LEVSGFQLETAGTPNEYALELIRQDEERRMPIWNRNCWLLPEVPELKCRLARCAKTG